MYIASGGFVHAFIALWRNPSLVRHFQPKSCYTNNFSSYIRRNPSLVRHFQPQSCYTNNFSSYIGRKNKIGKAGPRTSYFEQMSKVENSKMKKTGKENGKRENGKRENGKKENARRNTLYPPATVTLQVVGSGAPGAPSSLYLFTGQKSYLFNCGEGSQRLAHENKVKLTTMNDVFLTHKSWRNVGGLPGMLLTLQDACCTDIVLHGPPGLHVLYEEAKSFMLFDAMELSHNNHATNNGMVGTQEDPLTIQAVPILLPNDKINYSHNHTEFIVFSGSGLSPAERRADKEGGKRPMTSEVSEQGEEQTSKRSKTDATTTQMAMAYICKVAPKLGALDPMKCLRAKVPPGPLLGQLKKGLDVTLPDGSVVRAADVKDPDDPGPVFLIVEAPTKEHLRPLVENAALARHQAPNTKDTAVVVAHFTPHSLVQDPLYQSWLAQFPPSTSHLFLNEASSCMGSMAVHRMQRKLNFLQPEIFPLLADNSLPNVSAEKKTDETPKTENERLKVEEERPKVEDDGAHSPNMFQAVTMLTHRLRPALGISRNQCISIDGDVVQKEIEESGCQRQPALYPDLKEGEQTPACTEYPRITFMGTGSCMPNKTRNVSGILVQLQSDKYMILDCGEGSYGQLVRLLGMNAASDVLANLAAVYVSHPHADHHLGLIGLLINRRRVLEERGLQVTPLPLLAPANIVPFLSAYSLAFESVTDLFSFYDNCHFIDSEQMKPEQRLTEEQLEGLLDNLSLSKLETCTVIHCQQAYGVALTTDQGKKLVYSGDCRPSSYLVEIGLDCDLLIHEATMEDFLADEAFYKRHCTISEALKVSRDMRAKMVLLTHFSQRYSKVVMPLPDDAGDFSNVAFAYDNMTVSLSELPRAAALYPHLLKMFAEYVVEMKDKTAKKMKDRLREDAIKEDLLRASS